MGKEARACARCGGSHPALGPCSDTGRTLLTGASAPAPAALPPDPLVGAQVGSFKIVRMLGRGGMGTVYLAEHPAIGSRVAIKFLHPSMAGDPEAVGRFHDEARAVNLIGHENIVAIYDLDVLPPDRCYFVMELLEGETLTTLQARGRPERRIALEILLQLCDALGCAHARGVIHRDLKPDNVFLVPRRGTTHFVKLVDFGIAKLRDAAGPRRTQAGFIMGTPEYMAPEQCEGGPIDTRTDVYALGVMAYELVTGRLPFTGQGATQLLLAHLRDRPPRPSLVAPEVEPDLERVILRAVEKSPAERFPDMGAFAAALRHVLDARRERGEGRPRTAGNRLQHQGTSPEACSLKPGAHAAGGTSGGTAVLPTPGPPLVAELRGAGPARRYEVVELTRAGMFLRAEGALPPLLARVRIGLEHATLGEPLELTGEVVRHVSPAEAAAWKTQPGFALQLVDPGPGDRIAVAAVLEAGRRASGPAAAPPPTIDETRLEELESRADGHYAFLGLPAEAEFAEVRRAAREIGAELEAVRLRPLEADHPARAAALSARLAAAAQVLGAPAERLRYDAERGNWRGVARCIAAGVPAAIVASRREELLDREPARRAEAARQLARAQVARKLGNSGAALAAYDAALTADPLDVETHRAYAAYLGEVEAREG